MNTRARIFFSGTVQGVGFRYTVSNVARRFAVSGWVRNRSDGRVEVLAEGSEADVTAFIQAIEDDMSGYISQKMVTWERASGDWSSFSILATE